MFLYGKGSRNFVSMMLPTFLRTCNKNMLILPPNPGCWLVTTRMTAEPFLGLGIPT